MQPRQPVRRLEARLDPPLAVLGLVWLALLIVEPTRGLSPFLTGLRRPRASWKRGMRALGRTMGRRGFGYVMLVTLLVLMSGAPACMRSNAA